MNKSLIEELIEAKHEHDPVLVSFCNDGKARKDEQYMVKYFEEAKDNDKFYLISESMKKATKMYAYGYDFDTITMDLKLGLVYDVNELDENYQVKENSNPVDGIVRFYSGIVNSYLDGKKTNKYEYDNGYSGFIKFDDLMSNVSNSGLEYTGPNSFEELKERILNNEKFDISLIASLKEKEDQMVVSKFTEAVEEVVVEENTIEEKPKSKIKRFFGI